MNILIFSWRGLGHPHAGGAEIVTHEHAKSWVAKGHKVTLFTSAFPQARKQEVIDGVAIIRQGGQVFGVQIRAFFWYLFQKPKKYDLIIDQFHGIPFFTPLYIRTKKLAFIHEVTKNVWLLNQWPKPFNLLPALIGPVFEPLIFKLLYKNIPFMVVSESTRNDLVSWNIPKRNIYVVHNGINLIKPKKIVKNKKITITYLGVLSKDKGIEYAIKVFALLNKNHNDAFNRQGFNFWVIGTGASDYLKDLKKKCKDLKLDVKFWGYVDEKTKFELLTKSYLLINPSVREGWGLVVIEAASVGVPTVGFNVPGIKDSVVDKQTGLLSTPFDVSQLAENIIKLIADKKLYQRVQKNCLQRSKHFSWTKSASNSLRLLQQLEGN